MEGGVDGLKVEASPPVPLHNWRGTGGEAKARFEYLKHRSF